MARMKDAFRRFLESTSSDGAVIVCADDANAVEVTSSTGARVLRYALDAEADLRGINTRFDFDGASFDVELDGKRIEGFTTKLPGRHNVLNALAAIQTGLMLDLPIEGIRNALAVCPRVDRRLHSRAAGGITVVDDYGHHPTEIRATLRTIREAMPGRLLCVFQPHRYTRTRDLMDEYGSCFDDADLLYILPVYPANESPIPGATSEAVAESVSRSSSVDVRLVGRGDALDAVMEKGQKTLFSGSPSKGAAPFSVIVFLGAGDIVELADELVERIG
jgi:UDP-N-acetylmuramate--alanine ligase